MATALKEAATTQKIGLVSFRFSNVGIFSWNRSLSTIKKLLEKHDFKIYLYIKVFGEDELWAITSFEETGKLESLEKAYYCLYCVAGKFVAA
jgi:hypothetical protein